MSNDRVYILGGYQTDFSRNWSKENKHIAALMREAFEGSIASCDIDAADIGYGVVGNFCGELYAMQGNLGSFYTDFDPRLSGVPTMRVEAACASGSIAILVGQSLIRSGECDLAHIMGVEQMKTVDAVKGSEYLGTAAWYEREAKGIEFSFPKLFCRLADEYDKRYGIDSQYLSLISAKNYANAKRNPNAQTRTWYMSFDHANSVSTYNPIMWGMLKVSDCSQITDGAASLFLASPQYAQNYANKRNIPLESLPYIKGWGHTTAPLEFSTKIKQSEHDRYVLPQTRRAIMQAFDRAGISDWTQLDVIETHDCFTSSEYMSIDQFGLTEPGESWKAVEDGTVMFEGKLPINPSGGLIGGGHPVGATGVRQALDVFKQVTGKAGEYQVENARIAATLNIGGSATTNVSMVIGR